MEVGSTDEAETAARMYVDPPAGEALNGWRVIGGGKERVVYLSPTGTVYKAGDEEPALAEHNRFIEMLEGDLAEHIPPHTMYEVTLPSGQDDEQVVGVIAMPYLPHDGSVDREHDARAHKLLAATGDINMANVHANRGRLWLTDGAGLPGLRDWGR